MNNRPKYKSSCYKISRRKYERKYSQSCGKQNFLNRKIIDEKVDKLDFIKIKAPDL